VGGYFALWVALFVLLRTFEGFEASEAVAALAILGVIFPALAMLTKRRVPGFPRSMETAPRGFMPWWGPICRHWISS
jgi:hypothetical protein